MINMTLRAAAGSLLATHPPRCSHFLSLHASPALLSSICVCLLQSHCIAVLSSLMSLIFTLCAIHAITQLTHGPPKLGTRSTTVGQSMNVTGTGLHVRVPLCWTVYWIYLKTCCIFLCTAIVTRV